MTPAKSIQHAAHIAELRQNANEMAASARPAAVVEVSHDSRRRPDHRRLLLLLAQERRRRARLVAELMK
jgi:hypothetical protein